MRRSIFGASTSRLLVLPLTILAFYGCGDSSSPTAPPAVPPPAGTPTSPGWTLISPTAGGVTTINQVRFASPTRAFAVGRFGTLLRSDNAGVTWARLRPNWDGDLYALEFYDTKHGVAVGDGMIILATHDGGETWVRSGPMEGNRSLSDVAFVNRDTVVAVGSELTDPLFAVSEDGGDAWSLVATGLSGIRFSSVAVSGARVLALEAGSATMHEATELGRQWTTRSLPQPCDYLGFADDTTGVLVAASSASYRTINGGVTWSFISLLTAYGEPVFQNPSRGVIVDFANVSVTQDAGVTWQSTPLSEQITTGQFGDDAHGVFFAPLSTNTPNQFVDAYYTTSNGGASLTPHPTRPLDQPTFVDFVSPSVGFVTLGGRDADISEVAVTRDGGDTWASVTLDSSLIALGPFALSESRAWAMGIRRIFNPITAVHRTDDGGNTWPVRAVLDGWYSAVYFADANRGFAIGRDLDEHTSVLATVDGGTIWSTVFTGTDDGNDGFAGVSRFSFAPGGQVGVGWTEAAVLVTRDGGVTWLPIDVPSRQIVVLSDKTWVAPGFRSVDSGYSWQPQDTERGVGFYDSQNGVAISATGRTLFTRDGGVTWNDGDFLPTLPMKVKGIDMPAASTAYIVYECGVRCADNVLAKTTTAGR